ncbi:Holliday junction branch migration protein RuvA [Mesonia ostreae]|uniref:Holliday junction branch migration complex subunit RuvA n=1 Tax=Mesonia ostreae TaxID=861110 RepID=A0ABU2KFF6_9FLAO|nr:Holliday junction branch migration protein RuvA [Mesonia ostreae]MDT0293450.1 Holliday junction branch migration protein RuvA [Mesonia ostreae]
MIEYLKGKMTQKNPTDVTVECGGVGYFLNISLHTFSLLPENENILIYTYLQVREDAHTLFGFMEKSEREMFKKLISVSGIGASIARTMLSSLSPAQIVEAITTENVPEIQSVKGIGAKTAQRVIIDLKDKLGEIEASGQISTVQRNSHKDEALSALETLGYTRKQSEKLVSKIIKSDESASVETIIKLALKNL